jgi:hypothetical protein
MLWASRHVHVMSVITLKADIHQRGLHVCLVPLAHISTVLQTTLGLQQQSPIWAAAVFNTLSSLVRQTHKVPGQYDGQDERGL